MNWETYLAFGDSITIGARSYLGYPELVGDKLSNQLNKHWSVINHAVSGYKAIDLARFIDLHFASLKLHQPAVISILIGTNDVKERTSLNDFKVALNQVFLKAKLLNNFHVMAMYIPKFQEGIMYPYTISMNQSIDLFNKIIEELAQVHGIKTLHLDCHKDHFYDGVHLNDKGNQVFADQIVKFILKDKGISIE